MAGIWSRFFGTSVSTAAGYGMGSAIGPALRPITQAVANEAWATHPNRPLSPQEAAEAVVRGVLSMDDAAKEALANGINAERFKWIEELAGQPPGPQQVLELWNRGAIDEAQVDKALRQSRLRPEWVDPIKALKRYLPSVSDLITWGVREVFSPAQRAALDLDADFPPELADRLAELGYSEGDARNAWAGHWQLPSRVEGAQMLFRGELSSSEYADLLRALDYAPVWRKPLETIARAIPGLSDMVRFAVREVYDPARRSALKLDEDYPAAFTGQAAMHGLSEEHARDYWAGHWQLPSPTQMYRMLWRGEITLAELDAGLKAADYSPAWRDKLRNIAYLVPGRVDLRRMLAHNIIDRAEVKRGYQRLGYTAADAETLTKFAEELAVKGPAAQTSYIGRARSSLFGRVHTEYTGRQLTDDEARSGLEAAGVPAAEVAPILELWQTESSLIRTELTQAQIVKAFKKGLYDRDQALAELVERGMTEADAATRLDEG